MMLTRPGQALLSCRCRLPASSGWAMVILHRISQLLVAGLNLAGIALVLDLEADNDHLRTQLDDRATR